MDWHCNLWLSERQEKAIRSVAEQSSLSLSELLRRIIDHAMQTKSLNEIVPCLSGHIHAGVK